MTGKQCLHRNRRRRSSMKKVYISAIMSVVVLLMAACSSPAQPTPTPAPQKVRLQLSWTDNHEYAGFYWADKLGFNQEENLIVELVPFNFDQTDLVKQVTSGTTEFAISSGDQLLLERAKGAPIVAIATIYQRSPYCFISLKESKILKPADLVGKKILLTQRDEMFFNAMMTSQKLDPKLSTVIYRTD